MFLDHSDSKEFTATMYLSRKTDPEKAKKELKRHILALGVWIGFVRVLPYALQALQDSRGSA